MSYRMLQPSGDRGIRSFRMRPIRALDFAPPLGAHEAFVVAGGELEIKNERPLEALGFGDIARRLDEFAELLMGDCAAIEIERIHGDLAHGTFAIRQEALRRFRAHEKRPAI